MPDFFLKTIDNVEIFSDWREVAGSQKAALLLHQRGKELSIWNELRKVLETKGWNTLAIDLRGHGRSQGFGKNKDLKFDHFEDYHSMYFDVTAAMDYLKQETPKGKFIIIGSSIGANLALAYAADHFEVNAAALLSPGLNYYGLRTDDVMVEFHRSLALITAKDDPSYPDAQKLIKEPGATRPSVWYKEYDTGGHGVDLFKAHPELTEELAGWMDK